MCRRPGVSVRRGGGLGGRWGDTDASTGTSTVTTASIATASIATAVATASITTAIPTAHSSSGFHDCLPHLPRLRHLHQR